MMDGIFVCACMVQFISLTKAICISFQATTYKLQLLYSDKTGQSKVATVSCEEETNLGPRAAGSPTKCIHPTTTASPTSPATTSPTSPAPTTSTPHGPQSELFFVCFFNLFKLHPVLCLNAIVFQIVLYLPRIGWLVVHLEYLSQTVKCWDAV